MVPGKVRKQPATVMMHPVAMGKSTSIQPPAANYRKGPATAEKIISYRQKTPFKNIEELKNVNGIGDKTFEKMKEQVTI